MGVGCCVFCWCWLVVGCVMMVTAVAVCVGVVAVVCVVLVWFVLVCRVVGCVVLCCVVLCCVGWWVCCDVCGVLCGV